MYPGLRSEILPHMIPPQSNVLVAVSGGPDSVALAHVIWRYQKEKTELNLSMVISHVNHGVREEAKKEAKLVQDLARRWGVPLIIHSFDAKKHAKNSRKSFQEASREWRYARWQEDMVNYRCNLLATAHHLGDQAETVLYRLLRGSGTAGLAGIYPVKNNIIRPLLSVSKEEIFKYCEQEKLPYALDQSNYETVYERNRIRLELIPELEKKYNEKLQETLGRAAELLRWDEMYLSSQVDQLWQEYSKHHQEGMIEISRNAWNLPEAILSRMIRKAVALISGEPRGIDFKLIKLMMKEGRKTGWSQDLPGLKVKSARNGFFFFRRELEQESTVETNITEEWLRKLEINLSCDRWYNIPEIGLRVGLFQKDIPDSNVMWKTVFDRDKLEFAGQALVCRIRRPGDRIFFDKIGHKALKKVFQDKNITVEERKKILVFACGESVVWIPGISRGDAFLPKNKDSRKLYGIVAQNRG